MIKCQKNNFIKGMLKAKCNSAIDFIDEFEKNGENASKCKNWTKQDEKLTDFVFQNFDFCNHEDCSSCFYNTKKIKNGILNDARELGKKLG